MELELIISLVANCLFGSINVHLLAWRRQNSLNEGHVRFGYEFSKNFNCWFLYEYSTIFENSIYPLILTFSSLNWQCYSWTSSSNLEIRNWEWGLPLFFLHHQYCFILFSFLLHFFSKILPTSFFICIMTQPLFFSSYFPPPLSF